MTRGAKHHLGPLGSSFGRVTCQIVRTEVCLSLDNPSDQSGIGMAVNEKLAK